MTQYRVWHQKIAHRNWPVLLGTDDHPKQTLPEVLTFPDLESAKLDFCYWVVAGYELVRIERDYNSGVCGSIAIYNKAMDEYT
jgi:hypothetical protein